MLICRMDINDTVAGSKERAEYIALALENIREAFKDRKKDAEASTVQIECDIIDI